MYKFPIGVLLGSFKSDIKTSLKSAVEVGVKGIQVSATSGELAPENLVGNKRSEFLNIVKANGLEISALCGDFGHGFANVQKNPELIEKSKRVLDLAKELGTNIVTTHVGVIPNDKNNERYKIMQEACFELAKYADEVDAHFAIETGPEIATTLKGFLDGLNSKGVAVNLDPANFIMVTGDDPAEAVYTLKDYIVHTHAKDGRRLIEEKPEIVYGEIETEIQNAKYFIELPLGEGDVDFNNYLKALDEIGYKGFLTIEREVGANPKADIKKAVNYLNGLIK